MKLTFIRHGMTEGNIEKRYVGSRDEPLSPLGLSQVKKRARCYEYLRDADVIFSSPMKRCRQTAEILFEGRQLIISEGLKEYDFGEFEGKNHEELMAYPAYRDWLKSDGAYDLPAGEGMENFRKRVLSAFDETIKLCMEKEYENIVYVVHGGTIMTIFEKYDSQHKTYYEYMCKNAEGYRCMFDGNIMERIDG